MKQLKLNETPVRTSRNFNINNIKLENIDIPKVVTTFTNMKIIENRAEINNNTSDINLTYGIGDELINQIQKNSNIKLHIDCMDTSQYTDETEITFQFDKNNTTLVENIEIVAEENSRSTIILKYSSNGDCENWHNGLLRVKAKNDSELNIIISNLMNINSNNFMSFESDISENAKVNYTIIDFGGKNSITNYYSNIEGDNADNKINTIYLGRQDQLFDLNYIGELRGKKSNIDIEVQGALKDDSKKHFKGTIDFKKGCKKATGNENEACMLLSDTAKSLALPMLLCSEEDVEGNHSSSAGKIGEKELFYIMSRGFELKEAMKLMVRAKFNKILENIDNEKLKNEIIKEIDERLD